MTQAISSDKLSSPQMPTGRKDDFTSSEARGASHPGQKEVQGGQAEPHSAPKPDTGFQPSDTHYAQRLDKSQDFGSIEDAAGAAKILARLKGAIDADPQSAVAAHANLNSVSVEAALAAPLK